MRRSGNLEQTPGLVDAHRGCYKGPSTRLWAMPPALPRWRGARPGAACASPARPRARSRPPPAVDARLDAGGAGRHGLWRRHARRDAAHRAGRAGNLALSVEGTAQGLTATDPQVAAALGTSGTFSATGTPAGAAAIRCAPRCTGATIRLAALTSQFTGRADAERHRRRGEGRAARPRRLRAARRASAGRHRCLRRHCVGRRRPLPRQPQSARLGERARDRHRPARRPRRQAPECRRRARPRRRERHLRQQSQDRHRRHRRDGGRAHRHRCRRPHRQGDARQSRPARPRASPARRRRRPPSPARWRISA